MAKQSKAKQTKAFLKKGLLDKQIKQRHERRAFQQKVKRRQLGRNKHAKPKGDEDEDDASEDDNLDVPDKLHSEGESGEEEEDEMDLDAVLAGAGLDDERDSKDKQSDDDDGEDEDQDFSDDDLSNMSDNESTNSARHVQDLEALAEKDPEFFKYLQENDAELLDFDNAPEQDRDEEGDDDDDDEDEDEDEDDDALTKKSKGKERAVEDQPVLTKAVLRSMQKSVLETRSFRSLRKLLLAFRSAANSGLEEAQSGELWQIESPSVFNKLVTTALKYTPVVLAQQVPYKDLNGK
ncbi:hypothetical protein ACM66B_007064 [Microbotryomycetes sp. NB124-2]